jgi:signal transduction histidine kinase
MRSIFEDSEQQLTVTTADPLYVHGDRTRLIQVFSNILRNANEHTPVGEVSLSFAFRSARHRMQRPYSKLHGYEAAQRIARLPGASATVLVAMTGWSQEADREHLRRAGFHHHLIKPMKLALCELIERGPTGS